MPIDGLSSAFELKSLHLKNRIVMAPMTRSFSPGGKLPPQAAAYYGRRAEAEVGLIVTEGTAIDRPVSFNDSAVPYFHGNDQMTAWKGVVGEVHAKGGKIAPQLWHVGAARPSRGEWANSDASESPSGLAAVGDPVGRSMSESDIADVIDAFVRAAQNAKSIGFDALQLHGAHGFLFDQFFWAALNKRQDKWGGSAIRERSRFAAETIAAIRAAVGEDTVIMFRISQFKVQDYTAMIAHSPKELESWLGPLADAGVDIFDCSERRFWEPAFEGSDMNLAGWTKKVTGCATMTVGSVGLSKSFASVDTHRPDTLAGLLRRYEQGEFDLVGVGRALLSDAEWARKLFSSDFADMRDFDPAALSSLQ